MPLPSHGSFQYSLFKLLLSFYRYHRQSLFHPISSFCPLALSSSSFHHSWRMTLAVSLFPIQTLIFFLLCRYHRQSLSLPPFSFGPPLQSSSSFHHSWRMTLAVSLFPIQTLKYVFYFADTTVSPCSILPLPFVLLLYLLPHSTILGG